MWERWKTERKGCIKKREIEERRDLSNRCHLRKAWPVLSPSLFRNVHNPIAPFNPEWEGPKSPPLELTNSHNDEMKLMIMSNNKNKINTVYEDI